MSESSFELMKQEPFGPIGIIAHTANLDFVRMVSDVLYSKRLKRIEDKANQFINSPGYLRKNYILASDLSRFQTGEGKFSLGESARGHDIYIITDVMASRNMFELNGNSHISSADDHCRDLLRIISTCAGKAKRINVIMPFVYEGVQVRKRESSQESLDCAQLLKELTYLGVSNLIIFDPHDERIANAVPLLGIETPRSAFKIISTLLSKHNTIKLDKDSTLVVSPDETGIGRAIFYSSMLNLPLGIFYRYRDYTDMHGDGLAPIKEYKFLGDDVTGKDILLIDDIIHSGYTMLLTAKILKDAGARDIYCLAPFGLFDADNTLEKFDKAYESGVIKAVFCTNLIYSRPELSEREWFSDVNMTPYVARIIDGLNVDESVGDLINSTTKITEFLEQVRIGEFFDDAGQK